MEAKYCIKYCDRCPTNQWAVFGVGCVIFVKEKERAELICSILNSEKVPDGLLTIENWERTEE